MRFFAFAICVCLGYLFANPCAAQPKDTTMHHIGRAKVGLFFKRYFDFNNIGGSTPLPAPPAEEPKPPATDPAAPAPATAGARGSLLLTITEPGFLLTIDGRPATGLRPAGPNKYLLTGIAAGRHKLAVKKDGFRAEPESGFVVVAENQTANVELKLVSIGPGRWVLQGARPGTQVFLAGGRLLATADAQGAASGSDLPEGWQELELRLKGYHRRSGFRVNIRAGQEGVISGADTQLERIEVLLQLQGVEPKGAVMTVEHTRFELKYDGPNPVRNLSGQMKLPPGTYNLTFSAPGYESETITIDLKDYPLAPKVRLRKKP